jgi:ribosomal protein S18 acetylase RimI-like enzyme
VTNESDPSPADSEIVVEEVTDVSPELVSALAALVPQLSSSAPAPTPGELADIVASPSTVLFAAKDENGTVVGSLTLVLFKAPTGPRAWIEDVVVDDGVRRRGVGVALVDAALARAREGGARTVDLTSRPSRVAANRLYERMGFARRETNVYRYDIGD